MNDSIIVEGKEYISVRRAAEITKYSKDYVGQLCRSKKVNAIRTGRNWWVEEASLLEYKKAADNVIYNSGRQYPIPAASATPATPITSAAVQAVETVPPIKWTFSYEADDRPLLPQLKKLPVTSKAGTARRVSEFKLLRSHVKQFAVLLLVLAFTTASAFAMVNPSGFAKVASSVGTSTLATVEQVIGSVPVHSSAPKSAETASALGGWFQTTSGQVVAAIRNWLGIGAVPPVQPESLAASSTTPPSSTSNQTAYPISSNTVPVATTTIAAVAPTVTRSVPSPAPAKNIYTTVYATDPTLATQVSQLRTDLNNFKVFESNQTNTIYESMSHLGGGGGSVSNVSNSGSVTSVDVTGSTTGLTFTGGPITSAGTLELGGVLNAANGGTGSSTYSNGEILYGNNGSLSGLYPGNNGLVLKLQNGVPTWQPDLTGGGGAGAWATTSDNLALFPADTSQTVIIGSNATTSDGNILEVVGNTKLGGTTNANNLIASTLSAGSLSVSSLSGLLLGTNGAVSAVATSSLGLPQFSDLANYLTTASAASTYLSLNNWYSTTTDQLAEGTTHLYYTDGRVQNYLNSIGNGSLFSTTSADAYINASSTIAHPAGGIAGNLIEWDGTKWVAVATSSLGIVSAGPYEFSLAGNATSTLTQFNGGLTAFASTTIGNGTQTGGLTVNGGATTTGNAYFGANIAIGTTTPSAKFSLTATGASTGRAFVIANSNNNEEVTVLDNGKVGIGTTSPAAALEVKGSSGVDAFRASDQFGNTVFRIDQTGVLTYEPPVVTTGTLVTFGNGLKPSAQAPGTFFKINPGLNTGTVFDVQEGNVSKFIVAGSGNVGLATTSPWRTLSVTGSSDLGNNALAGSFTATSSIASVFPYASTTALSAQTLCLTGDTCITAWPTGGGAAYPFALSGNATSTLTQFNGGLTAFASSTIGDGTQTGGLTVNGGATTTGNAYIAGNVGIGTPTPTGGYKLDVAGSLLVEDSLLLIHNIDTGNTSHLGWNNGSRIFGSDPSGVIELTNFAGNDFTRLQFGGTTSSYPAIGKNGTSLVVGLADGTAGGSLGIGTTSPWRTLSVTGSSDLGTNALAGSFTATSTTASQFPYASSTALTVSGAFYGPGLTSCSSGSNALTWNNGIFGCNTIIGGSGGSGGTWSTTTSQVAGEFVNFSDNNTDIAAIGGSSTSTAKFFFDPNNGNSLLGSTTGIGTASPRGSLEIRSSGTSGLGFTPDIVFSDPNLNQPSTNLYPSDVFAVVGPTDVSGRGSLGITGISTASNDEGVKITGIGPSNLGQARAAVSVVGWVSSGSALNTLGNSNTVFSVDNGNTRLVNVQGGGQLGIGTTSPWRALSVNGSSDLGTNALAGSFTATSSIASVFPYASTTALTASSLYATTFCLSGDCRTAWPTGGGSGAAYPFNLAGNATSTLTQFNGGLTAFASSTIGNGTQTGGLTINGGATTTGAFNIFSVASPQFTLGRDTSNYLALSENALGNSLLNFNGASSSLIIGFAAAPATSGIFVGNSASTSLSILGATGGSDTNSSIADGGAGGAIAINAGTGGAGSSSGGASQGGIGGNLTLSAGAGGVGNTSDSSSPAQGGTGGNTTISAGAGGVSNLSTVALQNTGGRGGDLKLFAGAGGAASNNLVNIGGSGGSLYLAGGASGIGSTVNGTAGDLYLGYTGSTAQGNVYFGNFKGIFNPSTGFFGLGTTSPYTTLSVKGSSDLGNSALAGYFIATSSTPSSFAGGFTAFASSTIGNGTQTGGLTIAGGATTTGTTFLSGNVGIGTAPTVSALTVAGSVLLSGPSQSFYTGSFLQSGFCIDTGGSCQYGIETIGNPSTSALVLRVNNSSPEVILNNGNAGFGTSSPWRTLSVNGSSDLGNNALAGYFTATSSIASSFAGGLTAFASSTIGDGTQTGGLTISGGATTTGRMYFANTGSASILIGTTTSSAIDAIGGPFSIEVTDPALSEVGAAFDTAVPTGFANTQYSSGPIGAKKVGYTGVGGPSSSSVGYASRTFIESFSTNGLSFISDGSGDMRFYLGSAGAGSQRAVITNAGNFGLGTTSPWRTLSVTGSSDLGNNALAGYFTATSTSVASTFPYASTTVLSASTICISSDCRSAWPTGGGAAYPFALAGNATSTLTQFNGGLTAYASSTIGNGTQAGGLTIAGGATTTGALKIFTTTSPQFTLGHDAANYLALSEDGFGNSLLNFNGASGSLIIGFAAAPATSGRFVGNNASTSLSILGATGGSNTNSSIAGGGAGGAIAINAGTGGNGNSSGSIGVGGAGGNLTLSGGVGGTGATSNGSSQAQGGTGGNTTISAGTGGASNLSTALQNNGGLGGNLTLLAGAGGAASTTGGNGGSLYLAGGASGIGSTVNGTAGDLYLGYTGSTAQGNVYFGNSQGIFNTSTSFFGIGTTSPWRTLSVNGSSDLGTNALAGTFTATSTTATSTFAGGLNVGNGGLTYDFSSGVTSISNLSTGPMNFDTDAGVVSWTDLPLDSSASLGTPESYSAQLGGSPVLTVYGQSDGAGGSENLAVGIGTTSPFALLSVQGGATSSPVFAVATTTGAGQSFIIDKNGLITVNTPGATSTINGNLFVNGTLRGTNVYSGDLVFKNGFRFTEADPNASSTPSGLDGLYLKNQDMNDLLSVDKNGNLTVTGDICSNGSQCYGQSIANLAASIQALASSSEAASGRDTSAVTSAVSAENSALTSFSQLSVNLNTATENISDLSARVDTLASTTADLRLALDEATSTFTGLASSTVSDLASSTASTLATSTSFIQSIAAAVKNLIQSTGEWVIAKLTAHVVIADRVETQVAAVTEGLEMTDQATGQIYCVAIANGNFVKTLGVCGTAATSTAPTAPVGGSPIIQNSQPVVTAPVTSTPPSTGTSTSPNASAPTSSTSTASTTSIASTASTTPTASTGLNNSSVATSSPTNTSVASDSSASIAPDSSSNSSSPTSPTADSTASTPASSPTTSTSVTDSSTSNPAPSTSSSDPSGSSQPAASAPAPTSVPALTPAPTTTSAPAPTTASAQTPAPAPTPAASGSTSADSGSSSASS